MTRWGTLVIGYSLDTGYWSFNGHWVFGPWPFFRYSSLIHNSDFGIRHLLFSLLPTCLLPTCLLAYLPTCLFAYLPICPFAVKCGI